ncbi:MAG TPA: hypothetical protein DHV59_01565 [Oxalobacteraceae bacterium]|nr:hypothetical protein [Oxalobacteraceae bacterium]
MIQDQPLRFTSQQRHRLLELGLLEKQIEEVQRSALPAASAAIAGDPTLQDVRDEFQALLDAMGSAQEAMSKLLRADAGTPARAKVFQLIEIADFEMQGDGRIIEKALYPLTAARATVRRARNALADEQSRQNGASFYPVQQIDDALWQGFLKHYHGNADIPAYNVKRSSSETSAYWEIIAICYEAIGREKQNLERPIKAYLKWCKTHDQPLR